MVLDGNYNSPNKLLFGIEIEESGQAYIIEMALGEVVFLNDKLLISTSIVTSWLCKREYQPGDTRAEEKEDGDANDHIDGKGVKPSSSSSTSIAPPSSVVTPVVFLFDML